MSPHPRSTPTLLHFLVVLATLLHTACAITRLQFQLFNNTQCFGAAVRTENVESTQCTAYNFTAGTYIQAYCTNGAPFAAACDSATCDKCMQEDVVQDLCITLDETQAYLQVALSAVMNMSQASQVASLVSSSYSVIVSCPDEPAPTDAGSSTSSAAPHLLQPSLFNLHYFYSMCSSPSAVLLITLASIVVMAYIS